MNSKWTTLLLLPLALVLMGADGSCENKSSVDSRQEAQTAKIFSDMDRAVGFPAIVNYAERRQAKRILELRDSNPPTFTYTINWEGEKIFLCNSVGYGIPASVQFTNPERIAQSYSQGGFAILPQPDPNGLFMPTGLAATYVMCANPDEGGDPVPMYVEPEILVSPIKLH